MAASCKDTRPMTSHTPNGGPTEEEVRALVSQIVDGVVPAQEEAQVETAPAPQSPSQPDSIAIGADHGGFALKEKIAFRLREEGWEVVDCGTGSSESVDYPEFALAVARSVAGGEAAAGIMIDGAGIGSAMAANKVAGVRASMCYDVSTAMNAREHNHANVLTLGAGLVGENLAWQIVKTWLATPWGEGRHARRVAMIDDLDRQYSGRE